MMRNLIGGATLVLITAAFILMGCTTAKSTKSRQLRTLTSQTKSGTDIGVIGEVSDVITQRTEDVLQEQTITALRLEGIPESEAKVDVPMQSLLNLPDGAGYTVKDGQASVSVQRHGDNITVTGKCDSIARQCLFYEREVFRQRSEVDSLKQVISRMEQASSRNEETYRAENDTVQSVKEKPPATWHRWLFAGIIAGLLLTFPLRILKNRILTFLK